MMMKSLYSHSTMSTFKTPVTIFSTSFTPLTLSLHAEIQKLKTPKKQHILAKSAASLTVDIASTPIKSPPPSSFPKKILVPIGFGTEEMEAVIMVSVFRRAGAQVTVASVEEQLIVEASGGIKIVADCFISACSGQTFDLVALPGGMPGSARLRDCKVLQEITTKHAEEKRLYGAICAAPAVTLLPWGLLKRKLTTCHPAFNGKISPLWAVKSKLQVSGELTTSRGPGTSFEFAVSLVEQLFGEAVAKEICDTTLLSDTDDPKKVEFNEISWSLDHIPQVLIPVANGCEEIEVVTIVDILRRAKAKVIIATVEKSSQILGSSGMTIIADNTISVAANSIYDLIILPGGTLSTERLSRSRILKKILKEQDLAGRFLGALHSSPTILHKQGFLEDKRATAHASVISMLDDGVNGVRVVIDRKIITSNGLASTTYFALTIVSKFFGQARARSVAEGLVFDYLR